MYIYTLSLVLYTSEISDTHRHFPLFVLEVKIYYMKNAVFHFHC